MKWSISWNFCYEKYADRRWTKIGVYCAPIFFCVGKGEEEYEKDFTSKP